jgi:hypothetical protein
MLSARARAAALLALAAAGTALAAAPPQNASPPAQAGDAEAGRRIYMEGRLSSGAPLEGTVRGGEPRSGQQAACVSCHRRSGLGLVEGGMTSLPVTGDILYRPVWRGRPEMEMARTTGPNARPSYTDESLAHALVSGAGANGIALDPGMPRYKLPDADLRNLVAYLKTLSSKASPGADASTIRFATIVAGDVAPERRKALVDVMEAFVREKNAGTRYESRRRTRPPMDMEFEYIRYRDWILDVWTVTGPPASWPAQLEALYRKQPVFAVLSGVADGDWAPVHEFCESTRLPCVFPTTDLPTVDATDFYTVYFTRGMTLEGEVLATYVKSQPDDAPGGLVQVYREGRPGATAAAALTRRARADGKQAAGVALPAGETASPAFWERLAAAHPGATLALWLEAADLADLASLGAAQPGPARVFLSSSLVPGGAAAVPAPLRSRTRFVHPFETPEQFDLRVQRTRTWLRSRKIASPRDERLQVEAFFAVSIVNEALMHNYNFFVREYLVEQFERMIPSMVVTAYYPRMTLGADQRFSSKGAYIVKPGERPESPSVAVSGWIVP